MEGNHDIRLEAVFLKRALDGCRGAVKRPTVSQVEDQSNRGGVFHNVINDR